MPVRLEAVESAIGELRSGMDQLLSRLPAGSAHQGVAAGGGAAALPKSRAASQAPGAGALPGLDPAVVRSARQAGIPEAQLTKMSQLVQGARKLPAEPRKKVMDPLDDEEEEAEVLDTPTSVYNRWASLQHITSVI